MYGFAMNKGPFRGFRGNQRNHADMGHPRGRHDHRDDRRSQQKSDDRKSETPKKEKSTPIKEEQSEQDHHTTNNGGGQGMVTTAQGEKKFTGRCRLFVGNLPNDTTEEDFKKMFSEFGELSEVYINKQRSFGFVRLDTRQNAEAAKASLDGTTKKGRTLRVRFATHGAALKIKHLSPHVSNELLEQAFAIFGTIERAVVIVDDRGRPTGEGIVEFARKPGAQQALNRINEGVFIMGKSPRPITVEPLEQKDEEDGQPEKFLLKNQEYQNEREEGPRFAHPGSFEFEFAQKWKDLYRMEEEQREQLRRSMEEAYSKLEMEQGQAQIEHQAMLLRQDYLRKQEELKKMEMQHQQQMQRRLEMSQQSRLGGGGGFGGGRRMEEDHRRPDDDRRRQEMIMRQQQEEELRRRQMETRGGGGRGGVGPGQEMDMYPQRDMRDRNAPPMPPPPAPPAGLGLDRPRNQGMGGMSSQGNMGGQGMGNGGMGGQSAGLGGSGGNMSSAAQLLMVCG